MINALFPHIHACLSAGHVAISFLVFKMFDDVYAVIGETKSDGRHPEESRRIQDDEV